jgi:hypothetical protein
VTQDVPTETSEPATLDANAARLGPDAREPDAANGTAGATAPTQGQVESGCTQAQLRRFIKSRPYVPMHELRRRFELNGQPDDVSPIRGPDGIIYVGLPRRESGFMAELLRQGDIGVELCRDPSVPMVVGVFAMRPVTR